MKVIFTEYDGCFGVDLSAETMQEAALLTRLGTNATKTHRLMVLADKEGQFDASIIFEKHKRADGYIQKRR
ncbi:MAG: hypothetical protein HOP33_19170 [Verrucomicrobia bacterium]|nr:hypothetical protein [Verrucomicrobiota bacterium]